MFSIKTPRGTPFPLSEDIIQKYIDIWSGWRDLNPRHPAPKAGALPGCATPRKKILRNVIIGNNNDYST